MRQIKWVKSIKLVYLFISTTIGCSFSSEISRKFLVKVFPGEILKLVSEFADLISSGSQFQSFGALTERVVSADFQPCFRNTGMTFARGSRDRDYKEHLI